MSDSRFFGSVELRTVAACIVLACAGICWQCVEGPEVAPDPEDICPACTTAVTITSDNFTELTSVSGLISMVDFYSPYCGACLTMLPVVDSLAQMYAGRALIGKSSTADDTLYRDYGVVYVPTFVFFNGGVEYDRLVGVVSIDSLAARLETGLAQ